jgi:hypothetical protein
MAHVCCGTQDRSTFDLAVAALQFRSRSISASVAVGSIGMDDLENIGVYLFVGNKKTQFYNSNIMCNFPVDGEEQKTAARTTELELPF